MEYQSIDNVSNVDDYGATQSYVKVGNKNDNFMQWFLENKQGIENMKFMWRGWERDIYGRWIKTSRTEKNRIMNEAGIHWAAAIMESYLDRVFQSTNWNDEHMNYEMRKAYRVLWFGIMRQYKEFDLSKVNCYSVASMVLSRIHAMLLASRGAGIRDFIGTTQQITEQRLIQPQQNRGGLGGAIKSIFKRGGDYNEGGMGGQ